MKRIKIVGTCLATAAALAAVGVSAPMSASAAEAKQLVLSSGGVPLPIGSTAFSELRIAACLQFSEGHVGVNKQKLDKLTFKGLASANCEEGFASSGGIQKAELTARGVAKYAGNFKLTVPPHCVYSFPKFIGPFPIPGFVIVLGEQVGKLNALMSVPGCPETRTELFEADVDNGAFGLPLETDFLA